MGLQSFLSHAQDDPGTQEAIKKLLEKDEPQPPPKFISNTSIADSPPTRSSIPYDDPNVDIQPERAVPMPTLPPIRTGPTLNDTILLPQLNSDALTAPPVDLRQGVSTQGMSPVDAAEARLKATQGASAQQRINTTDPNFVEVGAPHGISRLKAAGRLFLNQLKSGHGLIGGLFGLGEGLIAPGHAQDLKHQQEIAEAQENLGQTVENAKAKAQIEDIQAQAEQRRNPPTKYHEPLLRSVKQPDGSEKTLQSDDYGQTWREQPSLLSAPPLRQPHEPLIQKVKNPDGSESTFQSNDFGQTWTPSKLPASAAPPNKQSNQWQVTNKAIDENIAGFRARQAKIDEFLNATPATIQVPQTVTSPAGIKSTRFVTKPNPAYESQKKERNDLDDKIAAENGKRKAAPPTRTNSTSQYAGKPWSLGAWRAKNPDATAEQEAAAKSKAVNAQMKIVE